MLEGITSDPYYLAATALKLSGGFMRKVKYDPRVSNSVINLLRSIFKKFFFKVGHSRPLFIYFPLFNTVDNKQMFNKILPMSGVEPRTSGIESDCSTN